MNYHLLHWSEHRKITFTRSRPGTCNDGAHVEQGNWAVVRTVVGYRLYDTRSTVAPQIQAATTNSSPWTTSTARPAGEPHPQPAPTRASIDESTIPTKRIVT
jgi:hypothetical protein